MEDSVFPNLKIKADPDPEKIEVDITTLLFALDYWLEPASVEKLRSQAKDGMLPLSALHSVGVNGTYDPISGAVTIKVPEAVRRVWPGQERPPGAPAVQGGQPLSPSDALFEQVFKKKRPIPASLAVGLRVEDDEGPEIKIKLDQDPDRIRVEAAPVFRLLESWITTDRLNRLALRVDDGMIAFASLKDVGLKPNYDDRILRVIIAVPVEIRRTRVRSLSGRVESSGLDGVVEPTFVSGYLNVDASKVFETGGSGVGSPLGPNSVFSDLDAVVNVGSVVFEGQANYDQINPYAWQRGDFSVTKDIPSLMLRATAGDLTLPTWGYENAVPMGGVGISTAFGTRPNVLVTALSHQEIELKVPATVNFFRNGVLLQTLKLGEGKYDLRDLPVLTGPNDLVIEVIDQAGRKETINLSQYYNPQFLAPGLSEVSYDVGWPSQQNGSHLAYDTTSPIVFLSHRMGITTELTAGLFCEHQPTQTIGGGTAIFPLLWGALQADVAGSQTVTTTAPATGAAFRGYYTNTGRAGESSGRGFRNFGIGVEKRTPGFALFGDPESIEPFSWQIFGSYTEPLSPKLGLSLGWTYSLLDEISPGAPDRSYSYHAGLNRWFDRGVSGTLTLSYTNSPTLVEVSGAVFLSWSFPEKQQLISASYDSAADRSSLAWNQNSNNTVGSSRSSVEIDSNSGSRDAIGSYSYLGNRGQLTIQEDLNDLTNPPGGTLPTDTVSSATQVTLSGALVFAGSTFALSQKVLDSFAIIKPGPAQRGEPVEVNPLGDGTYFAQTDGLGSAVLTNLGSYQKNEIHLGEAQLTGDASLPATHFRAQPTYKSGVLISLDSGFNVIMRGRLVDASGKPLARVSGEVVELSQDPKTAKSVPFFTNRVGLFQIESLRPGKYEMRFFDETMKNLPIEIPSKAEGMIDVGKLQVSNSQVPAPASKEPSR